MFKKLLQLLFVFVCIGTIYCQWQNEIDDDLEKQLKEEIPELNNFNASALPEKGQEILKDKCEQNGGPDAFNNLVEQKDQLQECFENLINYDVVKQELEEAEKTGSMDEVFAKYCNLYPEFQKCLDDVHNALIPCLEDSEIPTMDKAFNITDDIVHFACHNNGDRLAMFVAEGGVECLNSKKEDLQLCVTESVDEDMQKNISQIASMDENIGPFPIPLFILDEKHIKEFNKLHSCVRKTLETCDESTPANVVDAMFKYVKKLLFQPAAIEAAARAEKGTTGSAGLTSVTTLLLPLTVLIIKLT